MSVEASFLRKKFPNIHTESPVESAAHKTKAQTGKVLWNAEDQIDSYLSRLGDILFDGKKNLTQSEKVTRQKRIDFLKNKLFDSCILKPENIPEAYWEKLDKDKKNRGELRLSFFEMKRLTDSFIADQRDTLERWINEVTSPDFSSFPVYLRYWVMRSITKLSEYDKVQKKFPMRSKSTIKSFPSLNSEALEWVLTTMLKMGNGEIIRNPIKYGRNRYAHEWKLLSDREFENIMKRQNFWEMYKFALEFVSVDFQELLHETRWEWKVYRKWEAQKLSWDLQWYWSGWCTAWIGTAEIQLQRGDFYVYYSLNTLWEEVIPRLAIRMKWNIIAEIRGISDGQNIDEYIWDVLSQKLAEFWNEGWLYRQRISDTQKLTELYANRNNKDSFSIEDLKFLYEIDRNIVTFRQKKDGPDPRIKEILLWRNIVEDYLLIFNDQNEAIWRLFTKWYIIEIINGLNNFRDINDNIFKKLLEKLREIYQYMKKNAPFLEKNINIELSSLISRLCDNLNVFKDLNSEDARLLIWLWFWEKVLLHLDNFKDLDINIFFELLFKLQNVNILYLLHKFKGWNNKKILWLLKILISYDGIDMQRLGASIRYIPGVSIDEIEQLINEE